MSIRLKEWIATLPVAEGIETGDAIHIVQNGVSKQIDPDILRLNPNRGNYAVSGDLDMPSEGGNMADGTPKAGDRWRISGPGGTVGGQAVDAGAVVEAWEDTPGNDLSKWKFYF